MTFTVAQRRHQVALAAKSLDKDVPGWAKRINLSTLNMVGMSTCVLGQLFEDYTKAPMDFKKLDAFCGVLSNAWPHDRPIIRSYSVAWKSEIRKRRKK